MCTVIWGWATWRRAWDKYDVAIPTWRKEINPQDLRFLNSHKHISKHFINVFDLVYKNKIDTWDIQWSYACRFNSGLCITPSINMVSNIGISGVHAKGATVNHFLKTYNFTDINEINMINTVYPNSYYDTRLYIEKILPHYKWYYDIKMMLSKFFNKCKKVFSK
jgi:hypothetical protein